MSRLLSRAEHMTKLAALQAAESCGREQAQADAALSFAIEAGRTMAKQAGLASAVGKRVAGTGFGKAVGKLKTPLMIAGGLGAAGTAYGAYKAVPAIARATTATMNTPYTHGAGSSYGPVANGYGQISPYGTPQAPMGSM